MGMFTPLLALQAVAEEVRMPLLPKDVLSCDAAMTIQVYLRCSHHPNGEEGISTPVACMSADC